MLRGKDRWDSEFSAGVWDHLRSVDELAQNGVIAGYFRRYGASQAILDVCCGEGILQEALGTGSYERYLGVDISEGAIRCTEGRQNAKPAFVRADASDFVPAVCFQVIGFNEGLYDFDDPIGLLRSYERFLSEDGVFVVSMHLRERTLLMWEAIGSEYAVGDEVQVTNIARTSWIVKVLRPRIVIMATDASR